MNADQYVNLTEIPRFFTNKTPVMQFLALSLVFTVLFVVFEKSELLLTYTGLHTQLDPQLLVAIMAASGMAVLTLSRMLMMTIGKQRNISPMGCAIWVMVELIVTIAVMSLVVWLVSGGGYVDLPPLAGNLLMAVVATLTVPYVISFLIFRLREMREEIKLLHERLEAEPIVQDANLGDDKNAINFYNKGNRLVLSVQESDLLYIEAADNYVNIHYISGDHEETLILHNTLKDLEQALGGTKLLRCHRRYIVNMSKVRNLHRSGLSLELELAGCAKVVPVTKTYAETVTNWSTSNANN